MRNPELQYSAAGESGFSVEEKVCEVRYLGNDFFTSEFDFSPTILVGAGDLCGWVVGGGMWIAVVQSGWRSLPFSGCELAP